MAILQDKSNALQNEANTLQQKMIDVIKINNDVTSTHNTIMRWLTWVIVVLTIITVLTNIISVSTNYNKTGRYAISGTAGDVAVWVLDTKTSRLWLRATKSMYFGTNETPTVTLIESKDEQKQ